jgi:hypothetical protein
MSHPTTPQLCFDSPAGLPLEAAFDAGRLTSDGGLPWLAEADTALGLCAALAAGLPEWRAGPVRHNLATLVRQRIYQIACGYADQNDATTLRTDPLLKLVCGRRPLTGPALASQATFSRLENAVDAMPSSSSRPPSWTCMCGSAGRPGPHGGSSWTSTAPPTRRTGSRKGSATTATTASICIIRCWCSTATPAT